MTRSPFDKIKSLVERRKLFEAILRDKAEVVCKGEDESLFQFTATSIVNDTLMQGFMTAIEKLPAQDTEVIGNFAVNGEKFFFKATFKVMGDEAVFHLQCEVYQLQRRASIRLRVPRSLGIYLAVTEFHGKTLYAVANLADISAGGARIFFSEADSPVASAGNVKKPDFRVGDQFKCVLRISDQKSLDLKGQVKHIQPSVHMGQIVDHIGVEFVELSQSLKNRLTSMSMELQRRMIHEDGT